MRNRRVIGLMLLASLLLACNFPLYAPVKTPTPAASDTPTDTPAPAPLPSPTPTASPLATVAPTIAPTPSVPMVTPNAVNVNCRSGPDVAYNAVSALQFGTSTEVAGRLEDSSWWYVHDPSNPSDYCWVSASVVTLLGPTGGIPVQAPPPPIADKVTVDVTYPSPATCGGPNPVDFSGTISTNGATTVQYQWEITGAKSNTTSPESLKFDSAGTKNAADPGAYNVDCGKYKITLHVISPNDISASKNFNVSGP